VTVTAGGVYDVTGGSGIEVYHDGTGATGITSTATINSDWDAIYVEQNDGPVTVHQTGKLTVTDGSGIWIEQYGDGNVLAAMTGDIDATDGGIFAQHWGETGTITITTSAGSTIAASGGLGGAGIMADRSNMGPGTGSGGIVIDNRARIETDAIGIFASLCGCSPGDISITSAGAIDVGGPSGGAGILVFHDGNGTVSIETPGGIEVAGTMLTPSIGISVNKSGGGTVDIAAGDVSASAIGVLVQSLDDADLIIDANGSIDALAGIVGTTTGAATVNVAGTIAAEQGVSLIANTITGTVASGAAINVTGTGVGRYGLSFDSTLSKLTVGGTISAAGTDAILFAGGNAQLTLLPGFAINGQVDALAGGNDQVILGGDSGSGSFDLDRLGTAFTDFDTYLKTGASTWTLTGDAFTGLLSANGGTIVINDSIAGLDLVLGGATLKGNAAIRSLTANAGAIAPGNSIGTVTVAGDVSIAGATVYDVEVNAAGASDKIEAGGAATLVPTASVGVTMEPGSYGAVTQYAILTAAGGVTGTLDPDVGLASAFFDASLSYDPDNVYLTLTRNSLTLGDFALTPNEEATADALDGAGLGAPYFDELFVLAADEVPGALDAISGDGYASLTAAALDDGRFVRDAALDRRGSRGVWSTPYGGIAHLPGDGNGPAVDHATGGLLLGADGELGNGWLGVLLGYGQSRYDVASRDMSAQSSEFSVGAYGGATWDAFYASFGAAITGRDIDATRRVIFPGVSDTFTADYASLTAQAFTELGYRLEMAGASVTPFGGLAALSATTSGYTESGSGAGALTVAPSAATALVATLGLRLEHEIALENDQTLTLRASAAWRHAIGSASTANSAAGTGTFVVAGAPLPADTLAVSAGTTLALGQVSVGVDYTGSLGSGGFANAATATLAGTF
jgi:outer membrane autotransporter protein